MRNPEEAPKKSAKGRKTLMVFGILLLLLGVFLGAFVCSFQVMIASANNQQAKDALQKENEKLKEEVRLLNDQLEIMEADIERAKKGELVIPENTATASPTSTATSRPASTKTPAASATKKPTASATKAPTQTPKPTQAPSAGSSAALEE